MQQSKLCNNHDEQKASSKYQVARDNKQIKTKPSYSLLLVKNQKLKCKFVTTDKQCYYMTNNCYTYERK